MYRIIQFCVLVMFLSKDVSSKECNDCVNYTLCPNALMLAVYQKSDATMQLFRNALCGYDNSGKLPLVKVCCSMFPTAVRKEEVNETPEDIRIANHKNLELLSTDCGYFKGDRIVGGQVADLYEFPWMALISHETRVDISFKCGGSIINGRYILTAAHCVKNKKIAGVRVGEYDLNNDIDCQKGVCENHIQEIPVEKSVVHENYQGLPTVVNDIALLRLKEPIDFNHRNVHRICLPTTTKLRHLALDSMLATVTGWGLTENYTDSSVLLKVKIPIHTAERCSGIYNRFTKPGEPDVTADQLCAGSLNKDSCNGDSGGPLMIPQSYYDIDRYIQFGVVSHGPRQCGSDNPGVYTDLRKYMGWILDNISP